MAANPLDKASWRWLGRVPFAVGLQANLADLAGVRAGLATPGQGGRLVLFEPTEPVFTLGRRAGSPAGRAEAAATLRLCAARGVDVLAVDRGGLGTLHLPGQVVALVALPCDRTGLRDLVCRLLTAARRTAQAFGVEATCDFDDEVGLWTSTGKLASIGLHESGGITGHGLALNAAIDPALGRGMSLCGSATTRYATLASPGSLPTLAVASRLARELGLPEEPEADPATRR